MKPPQVYNRNMSKEDADATDEIILTTFATTTIGAMIGAAQGKSNEEIANNAVVGGITGIAIGFGMYAIKSWLKGK